MGLFGPAKALGSPRQVLEWLYTVGGGGVPPPGPPSPPPDQSDHRGKKRNLQKGKSDRAVFGTQTFGSQTPPPPPSLPSNTSLGSPTVIFFWRRRVQPHRCRPCPGPLWVLLQPLSLLLFLVVVVVLAFALIPNRTTCQIGAALHVPLPPAWRSSPAPEGVPALPRLHRHHRTPFTRQQGA